MADGRVGVRQATAPDRQIDNSAVVDPSDSAVLQRERVQVGGGVFGELADVRYRPPDTDDGALAVREVIAHRLRVDYSTRTDTQPVFMGRAVGGSASGDLVWQVTKIAYESAADDARVTQFDVRDSISWTNRATPATDGAAAWDF